MQQLLKKCLGFSLFICFLTPIKGITQDSHVLKLRKKKTTISIFPEADSLFRWQTNNDFRIISENKTIAVAKVRGINMDVEKVGENTYRLKPYYSDTVSYEGGKLFIYTLNPEGEAKLHTIKEFKFVDPEMPTLSIQGVASDSIIELRKLISGKLDAFYKGRKVEILSYTIKFRGINGDFEETNTENLFSLQIKNNFRNLNDGERVVFYNVKVRIPNGYIETIPIATFFIEKKNLFDP